MSEQAPSSAAGTGGSQGSAARARMTPAALRIEDVAALLRASGSAAASAELIQADIDMGAPVNPDGTMNFMHYAAWLERSGG